MVTLPSSQPEFAELLDRARTAKGRLEDIILSLEPAWIRGLDARATSFQSLWNVLRYTELSLYYVERHLGDSQWWSTLRGGLPPIRTVQFEFTAYTQCSKFGTFHLSMSAMESSHRSFLRALYPNAAQEATAEYKSVYDCLLLTHLHVPVENVRLLDLMRLIRNTVHNQGVHRRRSGKPASVSFKGIDYEFPDGQPIEFVTWPFVLDRLNDLIELQRRIVFSSPICELAAVIPDPSAALLD